MNLHEHILEIFLLPGDFYWGDSSTRIRTILGSCISICLWHPVKNVGGMCHYMLPSRNGKLDSGNRLNGKYGDEAWELFLREINKVNTKPSEYVVKLFGGSNMFSENETKIPDSIRMGNKNIEFARKIIAEFRLNLVSENLGGTKSRRIHFDVWSGNVWLRRQENE